MPIKKDRLLQNQAAREGREEIRLVMKLKRRHHSKPNLAPRPTRPTQGPVSEVPTGEKVGNR